MWAPPLTKVIIILRHFSGLSVHANVSGDSEKKKKRLQYKKIEVKDEYKNFLFTQTKKKKEKKKEYKIYKNQA